MMRTLTRLVWLVVATAFLAANTAVAGGYYGGGHYRGGYKGYKHYPKSYKHHRPYGHPKYDDGDVGLALGLGLLFGTFLGHALSQPRYDYYERPSRYHYHRDYYEYDQPRIVYREVVPSYRRVEPVDRCLQEREYQTAVVIDGQQVEAYGTACLQPDGSWRRGPAKLVSDYQ